MPSTSPLATPSPPSHGSNSPPRRSRRVDPSGGTPAIIPLSTDLFHRFPKLTKSIRAIWETAHADAVSPHGAPQASPSRHPLSGAPPPFKVGTLEMYRRFPEVYRAFMNHHRCEALQSFLHRNVVDRVTASVIASQRPGSPPPSPPALRVIDLGCGTGRIGSMLVHHPAVQHIVAYDKEVNMLPGCLESLVEAAVSTAGRSGVEEGASGSASATDSSTESHWYRSPIHLLPCASLQVPQKEEREQLDGEEREKMVPPPLFPLSRSNPTRSSSSSAPLTSIPLTLCLRPVSFEDINAGFFTSAPHPKAHVIVCAWSLSYLMRQSWGEGRWHESVDHLLQQLMNQLVQPAGSGGDRAALVIIETLGHGVEQPSRRNTLHQRLHDVWGFEYHWVRTDYRFETVEDAAAYTKFFFGPKVSKELQSNNRKELPECTGIWVKWIGEKEH